MFCFVETRLFTRIVGEYFSDEEYERVQVALASNPYLGVVIPGTGGVRKMRWSLRGRGKSGGVRIIYYLRIEEAAIWMLTIYAKNESRDIEPTVLGQIRDETHGEAQAKHRR